MSRAARVVRCVEPLTTEQARWVRGQTDLDRGRVAVSGGGDRAGGTAFANTVLDALGATDAQRLTGRVHESVVTITLPWLLAYRVRHLLVHRADLLLTDTLEAVLTLAAAAGATLWLTGTQLPGPSRELLDDQFVSELGFDAFTAAWQARTHDGVGVETVPARTGGWPPVPADDFPTFRAACRRALPPEVFTDVDALYLTTLADARAALTPVLTGAPETGIATGVLETSGKTLLDRARLEEATARYLHSLLNASVDTVEATVRVRAAQTAAFGLGWLLAVNLARLTATMDAPAAAALREPGTWRALRMFRYPHDAAICVLAALGLDLATVLALPHRAVARDGATVTVDGGSLVVPVGGRVLLRAQAITGQLVGRDPEAPFLHAAGADIGQHRVIATVRAALLDAGVPLLSRKVDPYWNGLQWFDRWGVMLQDVS